MRETARRRGCPSRGRRLIPQRQSKRCLGLC
nr:MAG TPA: hypothetical protein [Bacteriophage sp.]